MRRQAAALAALSGGGARGWGGEEVLRSEAEQEGKVGGQGEAWNADDLVGAAPPVNGRRRAAMPSTDMGAMRMLWCTLLRSEKCSVRQMKNATTL